MDYDTIIAKHLRNAAKEVVTLISQADYQKDDFQLFITFETQHPGVELPAHLKQEYPDEMTIVLQYEFENLQVRNNSFSISLSFSSGMEDLTIPFSAILHLQDPTADLDLELVPVNVYDLTKDASQFISKPITKTKSKSATSDIIDLSQYQD